MWCALWNCQNILAMLNWSGRMTLLHPLRDKKCRVWGSSLVLLRNFARWVFHIPFWCSFSPVSSLSQQWEYECNSSIRWIWLWDQCFRQLQLWVALLGRARGRLSSRIHLWPCNRGTFNWWNYIIDGINWRNILLTELHYWRNKISYACNNFIKVWLQNSNYQVNVKIRRNRSRNKS